MLSVSTTGYAEAATEARESCGDVINVTLISNAGLLLRFQGIAILLDGIYDASGLPFSGLPCEAWREMLEGRGKLGAFDYLIFTHAHPDHFSSAMTTELLRRRKIKGLFLPKAAEGCEEMLKCANERGTKAVLLSGDAANAEHALGPQIRLSAIPTAHLDAKYRGVQHVCYLLSFGEKRLLFTADMDYMAELPPKIKDAAPYAMFVNPLYFHMLRNRAVSLRAPHAERIYVYHIPFEGEDSLGIRARLEWDMSRWDSERQEAIALSEPNMELRL